MNSLDKIDLSKPPWVGDRRSACPSSAVRSIAGLDMGEDWNSNDNRVGKVDFIDLGDEATYNAMDLNKPALFDLNQDLNEETETAGCTSSSSGDASVICSLGDLSSNLTESRPEESNDSVVRAYSCDSQSYGSQLTGGVPRPRIGAIPDEQEGTTLEPTALEKALKSFAQRKQGLVVEPTVGTQFDSLTEAFEFYNLYSWEVGFAIRYDRNRRNNEKTLTIKDFVCICAGKPRRQNTTSVQCKCTAKLRMARSKSGGWYIKEHTAEHNHALSVSVEEKKNWRSHRMIDPHTKRLIKLLRDNNINLTKVFSIISAFFGSVGNAPFTKRSVRTLCAKIAKDNATDDVVKTVDLFNKLKEQDPEFSYTVELDEKSRIKTLLWTNGRSKMQYACFGDVITFDTTYKTNLYEMPFGLFIGVNNHFQSIVLGGVLMRHETISSFKWVFSEFVRLMGGKHPITILTD